MVPGNNLLVVRHGETEWNRDGRFQGHTDVPLNARGRKQAVRNAAALKAHLDGLNITGDAVSFISSPLRRATETARILMQVLGLPPTALVVDPRLKEAGFGSWEGLTTLEVKQKYPAERKTRKADRWNFRPPGGQSLADLATMAESLLRDLPDRHNTVLVSHSGNIRVICGLLATLPRHETVAMEVPQDRVLSWNGGDWTRL